jgi:hypothetical protein
VSLQLELIRDDVVCLQVEIAVEIAEVAIVEALAAQETTMILINKLAHPWMTT